MTPEVGIAGGAILEESAKIKVELLDVQAEVDAVADAAEDDLLEGIRDRLGYDDAEPAYINDLVDARVTKDPMVTPRALSKVLHIPPTAAETVRLSRAEGRDILDHRDDRAIVVVGPCSIHDPSAALEKALHIQEWRSRYTADLDIYMRAYFEKPRTPDAKKQAWKGFGYDPLLDGSSDINLGMIASRMIALQITGMGVPIVVERLNTLTPQFLDGLVTLDTIGARNTPDQKAREYISGTSALGAFKNTLEGDVETAAKAAASAGLPHAFLGVDMRGKLNRVRTSGNHGATIILRGSNEGPNYSSDHIQSAVAKLQENKLKASLIVDASHGNSRKIAANQISVIEDISEQIAAGQTAIRGTMIESNLVAGRQELVAAGDLVYGQSITDECAGLEQTENMLNIIASAVAQRRELTTT